MLEQSMERIEADLAQQEQPNVLAKKEKVVEGLPACSAEQDLVDKVQPKVDDKELIKETLPELLTLKEESEEGQPRSRGETEPGWSLLPVEAEARIHEECMQGGLHRFGLLYTMQLVDGAYVSPQGASLDVAKQKSFLHSLVIGALEEHGVDDNHAGVEPLFDKGEEWDIAVMELERVSNLA